MKLKDKLFIVSCQALKNEEMFGPLVILKMVKAVLNGGADMVRISQANNIKIIKKWNPDLKIIGLIKKKYKNSDVIITPTIKEIKTLIDLEVDIIAIDATSRKRPKEKLEKIIDFFIKNKKPYQLLLADCANEDDIKEADKNLAFNLISTTLYGYTKETNGLNNCDYDLAFIKKARLLTQKYLLVEGGINTPYYAKRAFELGANGVCVGSAITRPKFITQQFIKEIKKVKGINK